MRPDRPDRPRLPDRGKQPRRITGRGGREGLGSRGGLGGLGGSPAHRGYTVVVFVLLASLDNVAIQLTPPLFDPISKSLDTSRASISAVVSVTYLVSAIAAVAWAYFGDRGNRKSLLMLGTLIWAAGTVGTANANSLLFFTVAQVTGAIGLGAVASVGFSVVSDLIRPRHRGLVMSFWGLSQGVGTLAGTAIGGLLGASDWRRPYYLLTLLGVAATVAYLFTLNIRRGESEPALAKVFEAGGEYEGRISRADLPVIARRRTNVWLIAQGLTAQLVFGSLVFLPNLFQAKAQSLGYSQPTAIAIGAVYATLFQLGGVFSILGGLIGDRLQRRTPRGRALVAAVGILSAIPFYVVLFFVPLRLNLTDGAGSSEVIGGVLRSIVTEPTMALSLLAALLAVALTSANSPNWFALITDVNPPEHRGTVYSLGNLTNGAGRALGAFTAGYGFAALARALPSPTNLVVGLASFQVFFIPTGLMFWLASRSSPKDIADLRQLLARRADEETPR